MNQIEPFRIDIDQQVLDDLERRLRRTRFADQLPGSGWTLGTDGQYLRGLIEYWIDGYDWRTHEAALNGFDQFTTSVDGQRIHFIHVRSPRPDAVPLVLLHGWPSTFAEFASVIGPLSDPDRHGASGAPAFHVVCPSLPGYAFSGPTTRSGWTPHRIAGAVADLMARLGYDRYGAQGGDWGSMVASQLGLVDPDRVVGIHLNMVIAPAPPRDERFVGVTDAERADLDEMYAAGRDEMGYQQIQRTRPATLAAALVDSPVGLAGWIVEKFRAWTDNDGNPESAVGRDQLLTTIMLYWVTATMGSACRLYAETARAGRGASLPDRPVPVPMGYARFPADGFTPPRAWVERLYDVRHWTVMPCGGHFAAQEEPELLVDDIRAFYSLLGQPPRVVPV